MYYVISIASLYLRFVGYKKGFQPVEAFQLVKVIASCQ